MEKLTLDEILERFQNGEQRYDTNGYFKEAITAMLAGASPYMVLDRVLREHVILMHLHTEQLNKNQVAVAECARLMDKVDSLEQTIAELKDEALNLKESLSDMTRDRNYYKELYTNHVK